MSKIDKGRKAELEKSGYRLGDARFGDKTAAELMAEGASDAEIAEATAGETKRRADVNADADKANAESLEKAYASPTENKASRASETKGDDDGDKPAARKTAARKAGK